MIISNPESMFAEINIDKKDITNVSIGKKSEIISIAFTKQPIVGPVESIDSNATPPQGD
jgi:hypothetical protein